MPLKPPGPLSLVPFVSVEHMLCDIAIYIEEDWT